MIDVEATLLGYLQSQAALTALTGSRIWAGRDVPPEGYHPTQGAAITFRVRGGDVVGQQAAALLRPSFQFKIYGASEVAASAAYRALFDALEGPLAYPLRAADTETLGQILREPDVGWPFVLVFWRINVLNV